MWGAFEYRSATSDINASILASRLRAFFAFMTTPLSQNTTPHACLRQRLRGHREHSSGSLVRRGARSIRFAKDLLPSRRRLVDALPLPIGRDVKQDDIPRRLEEGGTLPARP